MDSNMTPSKPPCMSPMGPPTQPHNTPLSTPIVQSLTLNGAAHFISALQNPLPLLVKRAFPSPAEHGSKPQRVQYALGTALVNDLLEMAAGKDVDDGWNGLRDCASEGLPAGQWGRLAQVGLGEDRALPVLKGKGKVLGKGKERRGEVEELLKEIVYFGQKRRRKYGTGEGVESGTVRGLLIASLSRRTALAENILYDKDSKPKISLRHVRSHRARARLAETWNIDLEQSSGCLEIPGLLDALSKRDLKLTNLSQQPLAFLSKTEKMGFVLRDGDFGDAYRLDLLKMPRLSQRFEEVDFGERLLETETKGNKSRSSISNRSDSRKEKGFSQSKKGEHQLVKTARMSQHARKRVRVSWDECFVKYTDIERKVSDVRQRALLKIASFKENEKEGYKKKLLSKSWEGVCRAVVKMQRYFQRDNEQNAKKVGIMCAKERRRVLAKNRRNVKDYVLRAKRLSREMLGYWKKQGKELTELKKKRDRVEQELKKKEEERKEQIKQKKKIQYLIKRSEFYAQIMAQKLGIHGRKEDTTGQDLLTKEEVNKAENAVQSLINTNESRINKFQNEIDICKQPNGVIPKTLVPTDDASTPNENIKDASGVDFDFSKIEIENKSTLVKCPRNFNGQLKEYQLKGLRWLDNLYEQGINGILADEMGLGKTVQAIALMTHVAERKGGWGPFLIIAPTTTLFNWKFECSRFSPRLKILPYWGPRKDREVLRKCLRQKLFGRADSAFHIVITSYSFAVKDHKYLDRVKWQYIILDEAQAIKCIRSQRWRILLSLKSRNKMLLTGTPIQNTMAELWALLHFIMPQLFDSHQEFQEWFSKDIEAHSKNKGQASLNQIQLNRLHAILKPFMLRRVKKDVEKEIGKKIVREFVCEMSSRQKLLYNNIKKRICLSDLMQMEENKQKNQNLMNLVMQFRKVCNHPELFERKIEKTPLFFSRTLESKCHSVYRRGHYNMTCLNVNSLEHPFDLKFPALVSSLFKQMVLSPQRPFLLALHIRWGIKFRLSQVEHALYFKGDDKAFMAAISSLHYLSRIQSQSVSILSIGQGSTFNPDKASLEGSFDQIALEAMGHRVLGPVHSLNKARSHFGVGRGSATSWKRARYVEHSGQYFEKYPIKKGVKGSKFLIRGIKSTQVSNSETQKSKIITDFRIDGKDTSKKNKDLNQFKTRQNGINTKSSISHTKGIYINEIFKVQSIWNEVDIRRNFEFVVVPVQSVRYNEIEGQRRPPIDRRLLKVHIPFQIQFPSVSSLIADSSKLRILNRLLTRMKRDKHRVLIFCQMTKMMDIIEDYLQFNKYTYFRLDGGSAINERRDMVQQFQSRDDVFVFLLSTRAGGLGVTLTAADDVIFYDNDWNPTMDAQAEDRAHRIGRLKDVYVYRLVTKNTIEERILRRAQQKQNVQKTVYSGEVFKANAFSSNEMMNLCFNENELIERNKTIKRGKQSKKDSKKKKIEAASVKVQKNTES